jgi:hypothetical protein
VGQEEEQMPGVMLVSVCFALKATDSERLVGRSAFLGTPTIGLRPRLLTFHRFAVSSRQVGLGFSTSL